MTANCLTFQEHCIMAAWKLCAQKTITQNFCPLATCVPLLSPNHTSCTHHLFCPTGHQANCAYTHSHFGSLDTHGLLHIHSLYWNWVWDWMGCQQSLTRRCFIKVGEQELFLEKCLRKRLASLHLIIDGSETAQNPLVRAICAVRAPFVSNVLAKSPITAQKHSDPSQPVEKPILKR